MLRPLLFFCSFAASVSIALAQSPTVCTAENAKPAVVPAEGVAELVADIVIHCSGGLPTQAGQPIPRITVRAIFNADVTSKLLAHSPDLSEALLLIDDPAPEAQLPCPTLPCPNDGVNYNVFQATPIAANAIEWAGVPFNPPGSGNTRTLRITNVRADVEAVRHGFCTSCIAVFVQSPDLVIENTNQTLAYGTQGLLFHSTTAMFAPTQPHNPTIPSVDFTVTFAEGEPMIFKSRTIAAHPNDTSSGANQNIPGKSYPSASGFYNASFTGTYAGAGLADQGTRLMARFENVPPGVSLYVTEQPITAPETLRVKLVSTGPQGEGPYKPAPSAGNGFAPLAVNNGVAVAAWEVTSASPTIKESAQFGVAVSFSADAAHPFMQAGMTTVRGSLGPASLINVATTVDPVPRYLENAAQPAFTIGILKPTVAAVVNAADFARNVPVAPGSIASLFGSGLSSYNGAAFGPPQPSLAGTTVRINGITAPIFAATPGQVNIQIPWELAGTSRAELLVNVNGVQGDPVTIHLADYAPRIFVRPDGQPLILRELPLKPGASMTIYGTGFGLVQNQPATGTPAPDFSSTTLTSPALLIGGQPAEITFSGLAPGTTGVWQVNTKVPDSVVFYNGVLYIQLSVNGATANLVSLNPF